MSDETAHPEPPAGASAVLGDALPTLVKYAAWLVGPAVHRGLLGPREVPRVWDRHILNCAAVADLLPAGARLCDIGSGAGLPGIVLAVVRPDTSVTLLEPLLRRTVFLEECVADLGLSNVTVVRGRAEEWAGKMGADVVTARAVAPLERLAGWALPLLRAHGVLLAIKGASAAGELDEAMPALNALGARSGEVVRLDLPITGATATVVRVQAGERPVSPAARRSRSNGGRRSG